jgi:DNA-binding MurR/RpiR family transcriptional regulator
MKHASSIPQSADATFEALRQRIRDRFDDLSPHLQRIARLALDQPNQLALSTIAQIATTLDVQPSTLIRFAKELGYDGFSSLQHVFKHRLIEGVATYREEVYERRAATGQPDDAGAVLNECIDDLIASLEALRHEIDGEALSRAVGLCHGADHIYIAGLRRSRPISTYLAYGLTRLERRCSLLDFSGGMAEQQVANMRHEDLLVAIAFAPYSQAVVDVVRDAKVRGLQVIAITDTPTSPLSRGATLAFHVDTKVTGQFRPISGAIGLIQTIIVGLSGKL